MTLTLTRPPEAQALVALPTFACGDVSAEATSDDNNRFDTALSPSSNNRSGASVLITNSFAVEKCSGDVG